VVSTYSGCGLAGNTQSGAKHAVDHCFGVFVQQLVSRDRRISSLNNRGKSRDHVCSLDGVRQGEGAEEEGKNLWN
jgi:hypothetical protein